MFKQLLAALLLLIGCDRGTTSICNSNNDCRPGLVCDVGAKECVACLDNTMCGSEEFCCRGSCKARALRDSYCGCNLSINALGGNNCGEYNEFKKVSVGGPQCLLAGKNVKDLDISVIPEARCGCTSTDDCKFGSGVEKNLMCIDGKCDFQDSCLGLCGTGNCIQGSCKCGRPPLESCPGNCQFVDLPSANGEAAFSGNICVCSTFFLSQTVNQNVSCPRGYVCTGDKGCCKEGSANDCYKSADLVPKN